MYITTNINNPDIIWCKHSSIILWMGKSLKRHPAIRSLNKRLQHTMSLRVSSGPDVPHGSSAHDFGGLCSR